MGDENLKEVGEDRKNMTNETKEQKLERLWNVSQTELESMMQSVVQDLESLFGKKRAVDLRDIRVEEDKVVLLFYIEKVKEKSVLKR